MISNRFADEMIAVHDRQAPDCPPGFLAFPAAAAEPAQASPLQWLYQQMYQQAMRVQHAPKARDLFAVMN